MTANLKVGAMYNNFVFVSEDVLTFSTRLFNLFCVFCIICVIMIISLYAIFMWKCNKWNWWNNLLPKRETSPPPPRRYWNKKKYNWMSCYRELSTQFVCISISIRLIVTSSHWIFSFSHYRDRRLRAHWNSQLQTHSNGLKRNSTSFKHNITREYYQNIVPTLKKRICLKITWLNELKQISRTFYYYFVPEKFSH